MNFEFITPDFNLLLQSVRLDDAVAAAREAEKIISGNEIDWEDLYKGADQHCVKPQLSQLIGQSSSVKIPSDFRERLNDAHRQNIFSQLSYVDDFFKVRNFLEDAGIQIIPFKGFWMAHEAYGNMADRESLDVDVFVSLKDLESIKELMLENGYKEESSFTKLTIEEIKRGFQEYNFDWIEGDTSRFHIEFHWGICPPGYGMGIRLEDLGSKIIHERFNGQEISVFNPDAHLLLVLMHHGGKDRFIQLKQVSDIAHILKKCEDIDWKWVISEAKRFDAELIVYVGANLAATLTGVKIPVQIRDKTESKKIDRLAKNRILSMMRPHNKWYNAGFNYNNWLFRMRTRTGFGTRLKITAASGKEVLMKLKSAASHN